MGAFFLTEAEERRILSQEGHFIHPDLARLYTGRISFSPASAWRPPPPAIPAIPICRSCASAWRRWNPPQGGAGHAWINSPSSGFARPAFRGGASGRSRRGRALALFARRLALETIYNTQARDAWPPAPDLLKIIETEEKAGRYYEAWLWAGAITRLQPQQREAPRRTLDRLLEPLASWKSASDHPPGGGLARPRPRRGRPRENAAASPRRAGRSPPATTLSPADQMRLAEILLLAAIERVDETRAAQWLRFQYQIDPTRERFLRWRAFVIHNQRLGELLEFHRAARQAPRGRSGGGLSRNP
jgi:hypothetical protein